ncbi:murein biosynthesis integral membrane protein MurJ [Helicobacter bizzozeronii]|uniref:murein biosynthesis integral membrane protein MurJ n=1 Tax=Helicobacter bizzozeronii TaxID=56877 RepID=UPI000CED9982|nr:murein biosynthesis integral membrane protein MurJ [Helicobacter bizzozeronii]
MLKKFFLTTSSGILCSRIAGFIRDLLSASILGSGIYSDIFFVAFKFPNLFRRIFAEGAFTQSFLPAFIASKHKGTFSVSVLVIFSALLVLFSLLVGFYAPFFTKILAYGFDARTIALAQDIVAINFYYLLLVFLATFFGALLQYKNHFFVSAYQTILLNLGMIVALLLGKDKDLLEVVYYLSYGVLIGGVGQVVVHFYPLYMLGFNKLFRVGIKQIYLCFKNPSQERKKATLKGELKGFFKQFFPSVLGNSASQISSFIDTLLASFLATGSISYLYYANRIFQLPLALFAIAISTALFPTIAKAIKNAQQDIAIQHLQQALYFLTTMLLLCTLGGVLLSEFIISLLFERGQFGAADVIQSAAVFRMYLVGLLPFGLAKIFSLWLYAHHQQLKAAKISLYSLIFGTICSLSLMPYLQASGLALSSSLAGFLLCFLNIKAFGFKCFLGMITLRALLKLASFLALETLALLLFLWCLGAWHTQHALQRLF